MIVFLSFYGNEWPLAPEFVCGETIAHQDYAYSTVQIGDQCWFAVNCRYLPEVSPSSTSSTTNPYYYVFNYQGTDVDEARTTENYETYGVLYNWPAVMAEGICPSGWHIPSDDELTQLTDYLGGWEVAGGKMKDDVFWNGTNSSGFTGLPGGYRYSGGFISNGSNGAWWSASESGSGSWTRSLNGNNDDAYRGSGNRINGFSARCVRD